MGGDIDFQLLDWLIGYLGIDDPDLLVIELMVIRDWNRSKNGPSN